MVALAAFEAPNSPKADFNIESGSITFTRTFKVQTTSLADGPLAVASAPGIPHIGSSYQFGNEFFPSARLRHISNPERMAPGSLFWELDCIYTTPPKKEGSGSSTHHENDQQFDNPLAEYAEIGMGVEIIQKPITSVLDGGGNPTPIKNSAGQTYVPAPTKDEARLTLTITRNEVITAPHPATALTYTSTINSDVWWGQPAGTWKCYSITTSRQEKKMSNGSEFAYLKCSYAFHAKPDGWDISLLDEGDYYNDTASGTNKILPFQDDKGNPIQGLLDGSGHKLTPSGSPPVLVPVFTTFKVYKRQPFGPLNLPQSFTSLVQ